MMSTEVVVSLGGDVLALLGGGGVVLIAICGFLSKLIADRTMEKHKSRLNAELERVKSELAKEADLHKLKIRRAELLFERELSAVSTFGIVYREVMPRYSHPDMGWDEACEDVAERFSRIEKRVEDYLTSHAPVLPNALRDRVRECLQLCTNNKFAEHEMPGPQGTATANAAAAEFMEEMNKAEMEMYSLVQNETRILSK